MVIDLQLITDQSTWEDSLLYTMLLASGFKYQHINSSDFLLHSIKVPQTASDNDD
jgi:hypothetical protein